MFKKPLKLESSVGRLVRKSLPKRILCVYKLHYGYTILYVCIDISYILCYYAQRIIV